MRQDPRLIHNARQLRRALTPAEKLIWPLLRSRRFGDYRFRRQHVIAPYIADFYCAVAGLVIELDGETHLGKEEEDRIRQDHLEGRGLKVLRFWNNDVFENLDGVLEVIDRECRQRAAVPPKPPTSRPELNPSPPTPLPAGERGDKYKAPGRGGVLA
jgi:very-short-patch-repair endonuclease